MRVRPASMSSAPVVLSKADVITPVEAAQVEGERGGAWTVHNGSFRQVHGRGEGGEAGG